MNRCSYIHRSMVIAIAGAVVAISSLYTWSQTAASAPTPKVVLNAQAIGPRPIEDLTRQSVARDYAYAWQSMADALSQNRADLLNAYFTGFAKQNLVQRIASQKHAGVRVRYTDLGHKLDAVFYSPAGDAMQLRDHAQLEIQILDGDKIIQDEHVNAQYMVLMTPGADRWLVRDLQSTPEDRR